jgi:hypothetical protein
MKSLFQFLSEAGTSQASVQARKLNLKSDGHGSWFDSRGNLAATTEKGKLVFTNKKKKSTEDEGPAKQRPTPTATAKPSSPAQQAAPKPKAAGGEEVGAEPKVEDETVTIVFGRFNPPTKGHEKLFSTAKAASAGGDLKIYPSRSQDDKKNPLDPDMKISYMRKMFPDYEEQIVNDAEMKSIFDVLTTADQEYENVNIVVGADRQSEFENLANKYNGDLYDFSNIRVISAGVRDSDAEGVEGMSASKLRKAVADDDFDAFKRGMPKGVDDGDVQAVFNAVRIGMKIKKTQQKESYNLWEIAPKYDKQSLREQYVRGKLFRIGDIVESLNTGLVGEIIRRGTNHLICVTKEDNMFKSWIRDVMEYTEVHMKGKMRDKDHPNTLVGTSGYRKNAQASVPGQQKIKNFNIREFINKRKAQNI